MNSSVVNAQEKLSSETARKRSPEYNVVRVVSARQKTFVRIKEIWRYRQLLLSLIRKELKVRYKGSVLGFAWSMLSPIFTLTIFYLVFTYFLPNDIPLFAIYLLSGLLVWNIFSQSLAGATGSVVGNGSIVKKVFFPREILPLAAVGAALFNGFLQSLVMVFGLIVFRHVPSWEYMAILPLAILALTLFASGLAILLSAINVKFRDVQHLLDVALSLWFWLNPIVYTLSGRIANGLEDRGLTWVFFLNPITTIVLASQKAFYRDANPTNKKGEPMNVLPDYDIGWYLTHIGCITLVSLVIIWIALKVFGKLEGNFAEEL